MWYTHTNTILIIENSAEDGLKKVIYPQVNNVLIVDIKSKEQQSAAAEI